MGSAIEAVTGTSYRDHIRRAVLVRAGMDRSGFYDRREAEPDVAEGWDPVLDRNGNSTGWTQNIFRYPPIGLRNSYKDGVNAGASGILRYYPADQLDVVVLSNAEEGAWALITEIHRRVRSDNPAVGESGIGFS